MSAGTTCPRRSSTTSPGTRSMTSTLVGFPSRQTTQVWRSCECRDSAAFSARNSLPKPSPTDTVRMTAMMTASVC